VVADALIRMSHVSQLVVDSMPIELCEEFNKLNHRIVANTKVMEMEVGSSLLQEIRKGQLEDEKIQDIKRNIKEDKSPSFLEDEEGVLWYKGRICVPNIKELKDKILRQAHESTYFIHPRGNKMYHDLNATYWWNGMNRDIAICCSLRHLSVSQSQTSMTCWITTAFASALVELGRGCHRFYHGFAENSVDLRLHLGDSGSIEQVSSLYTYKDHLLWTTTSRVVYIEDSLFVCMEC
jgi:hypothetical protein